jgi:hypothetical protein
MTVLLTILFAGAAAIAAAAVILAGLRFGPVFRDLRHALAEAPETRTIRLSVRLPRTGARRHRRSPRPKPVTHRLHRNGIRAA